MSAIDSTNLRTVGGSSIGELVGQRELLWNLTLRELRGKYKRSALGWFWSLLNPISSILIYSVVFKVLLSVATPTGNPSGTENFALWLTCGLLPWNFLGAAIGAGTGSLVTHAGLMKKVYFPREYLVASTVLAWLVSFFIEMAVLSLGFVLVGRFVFPWLIGVAIVAFFQTLFGLGFGLALSSLNVYFRDVQHLIGIALQVWFYLTPIVYGMALITEKFGSRWVPFYKLNPMVHYVTAYRNLLYDGRVPGIQSITYIVGSAALSLLIGTAVFRRLEPRMVEEL